ncbi:metalloregulator ArsR/SmtB family transcription factor [Marinobacter xestospongiae]|uniref:ArsR/SmtB family transcription factor n=1 Tax=Marinobacter xestospongiae TaxID=994319 RepID=UPI0031DBFC3E
MLDRNPDSDPDCHSDHSSDHRLDHCPEHYINQDAMLQSAEQASLFLKSLANRDRLLLLCQLTEGEASVSDLELRTGIGQPSLSQQLGVLRREGLIAPRRAGKQVFYRLADPRVEALLGQLYELFCRPQGPDEQPDETIGDMK